MKNKIKEILEENAKLKEELQSTKDHLKNTQHPQVVRYIMKSSRCFYKKKTN